MKDVETKPEVKEIQKKLDRNVTNKVEEAIKELGIEDKIYDVSMQGSYEKGTDLPASGSDMDLFVVFNTDVSEEEKNQYGLEIGRKVLNKDFAESQGWTKYRDEEVTATSKYVQAFFKDGEQDVEVQIVPTKHLTLDQIRERKVDGKDIEIGMERTPHQTEYMKTALKGKEGEVRVLKKFMKDAGLYGSNLKQQGFSGYSAEVLIDEYGSFENVIDFFADLKEGAMVDKQGGGKRNKENAFSIIDPIDPNRDLVSAFSTQKIGKTINVAKKFKESGKIPEIEYREMDSTTITFDSDEMNEDKLIGQVRRMANSYQSVLGKMGFNIETNTDKVNGIDVELPNFSFDAEWDNDKKKNIVKLNLGTDSMTIPKEYKDKGMSINPPNPKMPKELWDKKIQEYRDAPKNKGLDFIEEDGKLKAVKVFPFTEMIDAIDYLNKNPEGKLVNTNQTEQIKSNGRVSTGKSEFQNI
jgi:tRNA nucleotidyltransferase (CCA-adding enzyme)